jgi:hypothetical protein
MPSNRSAPIRLVPRRAACGPAARALAALALAALAPAALAPIAPSLRAQPAPSTDVFLVPLTRGADGWRAGVPANLTRAPGYDNQPAFAPDARALFFTRIGTDGRADIWRTDFGTGRADPVARTRESEYSAAPTPDGAALAVVRVEADSTQRLWRLPLDGSAPSVLVPDVQPVGYFAFADDSTLALFVLGSPSTLQVATLGRPGTRPVARNVGRSLHRIPGTAHVSFVQKGGDRWHVVRLDPRTGAQDTLVATRPRREDHAWLDERTLVMGDGSALYTYTLGDTAWTPLADFGFARLSDITRLAVSRTPSAGANARPAQWLAVTAVPGERLRATGAPDRPRPVVRDDDVRRDLGILAADSMEGRGTGAPGGARAARWLATQFAAAGLAPAGDAGGFLQRVPLQRAAAFAPGGRATPRPVASWAAWEALAPDQRLDAANVVGVLEGADPARREEVVLVTAHYDHIGLGRPVDGDSINNGADDDASGTIGLLELARALAAGPRPARTIVFAAVTGEEVGLIGTRWYIAHPVRPLERTVANLNLEMIGRPDTLTGGAGTAWLTGYERSTFGDLLADAGVPIVPDPRPAQRFFERSDNIDFARRGIPAHTLSTYNLHREYHTPKDEAATLDPAHMARVIEAAIIALRALADAPAVPVWHPGGRP